MKNKPKSLPWIELDDDARRQYVDASAVFNGWLSARRALPAVRGGMYWKRSGASDYLVRTSASNSQKCIGPRSDETEQVYQAFMTRKRAVESREASLRREVDRHQRMNRALRVGRVPAIVVDVLNAIEKAGVSEFFTVVGTHALYAYEAAAGVRFLDSGALATKDIDLLWDTRKRIQFVSTMARQEISMIDLLRKVDPTFEILDDQKYTAMNDKGFEVDVIRRMKAEDDLHPVQLTEAEDDFWVAQAMNAGFLLNSPAFSAVVVSASGAMARMNTISPVMFFAFKRWLAVQPTRDPLKQPRDATQAVLVEALVDEFFPNLAEQKEQLPAELVGAVEARARDLGWDQDSTGVIFKVTDAGVEEASDWLAAAVPRARERQAIEPGVTLLRGVPRSNDGDGYDLS